MPIIYNEISPNSKGGTELVTRNLESRLIASGNKELLNFFNIYPSRVRDFNSKVPSILTLHDLPGDPESEHLKQDGGARFDAMVFVSNWQYMKYLEYYKFQDASKCIVIYNAIDPIALSKKFKWDVGDLGTQENPLRLIYHTTPHRGLEILVPIYVSLYEKYKAAGIHIHLDVFSSFKIYGWEQRDEPYAKLFEICKSHPGITYHGAQPNEVVREYLAKAHIFAYPSIWQETSCIAAIEAMSAACLIVHSNLGALPETTGQLSVSYPFQPNMQDNANNFYKALDASIATCIQNPVMVGSITSVNLMRANTLYSWNNILPQWVDYLRAIKEHVDSTSQM